MINDKVYIVHLEETRLETS